MRVYLCKAGHRYWVARWRGGSRGLGRRADAGGLVEREAALMACAKIEIDMAAGVRAAKMPTVSAWIDAFIGLRAGMAEGTERLYRWVGRRLTGYLGADTPLSDVTPLQAEQFMAWLTAEQHLQAGSVKLIVRQAKSIFQKAEDVEIVAKSPFRKIKAPKADVDRTWADVPLATLERLLDVSTGSWRGLLALCRLAGLRRNEALRLRWASVDLVGKRLTVVNPGKYTSSKKHTREVPVVPRLHDVLFDLSMQAGGAQKVCQGIRDDQVDRGMDAICELAHVAPLRAHVLRKARQKEWTREFGLDVAADFLGNTPAIAMKHYLRATDSDFERAAGVLATATSPSAPAANAKADTPIPCILGGESPNPSTPGSMP